MITSPVSVASGATGRTAVPSDALHGMKDCYKINGAGYWLVYRVEDVLVSGRPESERSSVYEQAAR